MRITAYILILFVVLSVFLAGCGKREDMGGGETASASEVADVPDAPDVSSVDTLDEEMDTADLDDISIDVDESLFE